MTATHTSCFRLPRKRGRHWQRGNREEGRRKRGKREKRKEKREKRKEKREKRGGDAGETAMGFFDVVISIRQDIKIDMLQADSRRS